MKKLPVSLLALLSLIIVFTGCQKDELYEPAETEDSVEIYVPYKDEPVFCGEQITTPLTNWDGDITAGSVTIGNDENNLYITFEADPDWTFQNHYIHADPKDQIPIVEEWQTYKYWDFDHWEWAPQTFFTVVINKADIVMEGPDNNFAISIYSMAENENPEIGSMAVWANEIFNESPYGYYISYNWQECPPPDPLGGPKLAFAYNMEYSECFKDIKRANGKYNPNGNGTWHNFWLWGWRAGKFDAGTYTFDLVAGANSCDPENGMVVGEVILVYDGSTATISYDVDPAYELVSTYAYAGKKRLPKKWGKYTVVPWFFPKKHQQINTTSDMFTFNNQNNGVYMAASAVVVDAEE